MPLATEGCIGLTHNLCFHFADGFCNRFFRHLFTK